jgi:hypothetical protein
MRRIYLSADGGDSGGEAAETITIGDIEYDLDEKVTIDGKEYAFSEIQDRIKKGDDLTKREQELDTAAAALKPFLEKLNTDPEAASAELQKLIDAAKTKLSKSGSSADSQLVKQLESQQQQLAKVTLDIAIRDMKSDVENYPHFKSHVDEVLKFCADNEIGDLEMGYHTWVGKNLKKLEGEGDRSQKRADATTLSRRGNSQSTKDAEWKPGEGMYNFLVRTGQLPTY